MYNYFSRWNKKDTYENEKEKLRNEAVEWQNNNGGMSYDEIVEKQTYFYENARKVGLVKEFRENGII